MLNYIWVMLGGVRVSGARLSACDLVALRFEELFPANVRREHSFEVATIHNPRRTKEE